MDGWCWAMCRSIQNSTFPVSFFADDVIFAGVPEEREISDDELLDMESRLTEEIKAARAEKKLKKEQAEKTGDQKAQNGKDAVEKGDKRGEKDKPDWIITYEVPF